MAKKKDKRVTLKIKKKPFLERLGKIFTGPTNLDVAEQKRRLNPPNSKPKGWLQGIRHHSRVHTDPKTGKQRLIENVTKPHYSEIEKFPYTDDPTFKNEMATQYVIEQQKTRQWIENVLQQNKENLKLPQSRQDFEIRKQINIIAEDIKKIKVVALDPYEVRKTFETEHKRMIDAHRRMWPATLKVEALITKLTTPIGAEAQFLKYKKDLHPEIRKKLQLLFPKITPKTVIPTKNVEGKTATPQLGRKKHQPMKPTVTSPESITRKIRLGYGDKLKVEALRTDPNFKNLSPPAQKKYLEFMHEQIKSNQPMTAKMVQNLKDTAPGGKYNIDKVGGWLGKNLSLSDKLTKDYIQTRRLQVIKEELRKLNKEGSGGKGGGKPSGKGIGALSGISSVLGIVRARKEAKKDLGREPSILEVLEYTVPPYARLKALKKEMFGNYYTPPSI